MGGRELKKSSGFRKRSRSSSSDSSTSSSSSSSSSSTSSSSSNSSGGKPGRGSGFGVFTGRASMLSGVQQQAAAPGGSGFQPRVAHGGPVGQNAGGYPAPPAQVQHKAPPPAAPDTAHAAGGVQLPAPSVSVSVSAPSNNNNNTNSKPSSGVRSEDNVRVFLGNVPSKTPVPDVLEVFQQQFGRVHAISMPPSKYEGRGFFHKGFGFVDCASPAIAKAALIAGLIHIDGQEVTVALPQQLAAAPSQVSDTPLFILGTNSGRIPDNEAPASGGAAAMAGGPLNIPVSRNTTRANSLLSKLAANTVPLGLTPGSQLGPNASIRVGLPATVGGTAQPIAGQQPPQAGAADQAECATVCLGNMVVTEDEADETLIEDVRDEVSRFGDVRDITIHIERRPDGTARKIDVWVKYGSVKAAEMCVEAMNGRRFDNRRITCGFVRL